MIATTTIKCNYSNPVTFDGTPSETKQDVWEFASSTCYANTQNENPIFFTYGEIIMSFFLFLVLIFLMTHFIREWIFIKRYKND
jgi:hypothetical protein